MAPSLFYQFHDCNSWLLEDTFLAFAKKPQNLRILSLPGDQAHCKIFVDRSQSFKNVTEIIFDYSLRK